MLVFINYDSYFIFYLWQWALTLQKKILWKHNKNNFDF